MKIHKGFLASSVIFLSAAAFATSGGLDISFNGTGQRLVGLGGGSDYANAEAQQADGKIVTAGTSQVGGHYVFAVARYNTDGSLDTTFGVSGVVYYQLGSCDAYATGVAILSSGNIVVAGWQGCASSGSYSPSSSEFTVLRLNADGSLDTTFGSGGVTVANSGICKAVAIDANGGIFLGGYTVSGSNFVFALAHFSASGAVDASFGSNGVATAVFNATSDDEINALAIQSDGKILAAGSSTNINTQVERFALVRFNTTGSLDTNLNTTGKITTSIGSNNSAANAIVIQTSTTSAKIVLAGNTLDNNFTPASFAVARYNLNDGSLDTTLNGTGTLTTAVGTNDNGRSVFLLYQNGNPSRIFVGGYAKTSDPNNAYFTLLKYNLNGTLDTTFNGTGEVATAISTGSFCNASQLASGKALLVGGAYGGLNHFALARYNASSGALDTTFNTTGVRTDDLSPGGFGSGVAVAVQHDGKVVTLGYDAGGNTYLIRLNADGTLDTSFNGSGEEKISFTGQGMALQPNGKILVCGQLHTGSGLGAETVACLSRYNSDGSLDTSNVGSGSLIDSPSLFAIAVAPDGTVFTAGRNNSSLEVRRYFPGASNQGSFGSNGVVDINQNSDTASAIALQADGKIVVAGSAYPASNSNALVVRLNNDGTLDTTFNGTGSVTLAIGPGNSSGSGVAIQGDGKIVVTGNASNGTNYDFALFRCNSNGALDSTFGTSGIVRTAIGSGDDEISAMALQIDGKILVAGYSAQAGKGEFALARYNTNGSLDSSYGTSGIQPISFAFTSYDFGRAVAIDALGRAVTAGSADGYLAIARTYGDPFVKITSIALRASDSHLILDGLALPAVSNSLEQAASLSSTGNTFSLLTTVAPNADGTWEVDLGQPTPPHFYKLTSP